MGLYLRDKLRFRTITCFLQVLGFQPCVASGFPLFRAFERAPKEGAKIPVSDFFLELFELYSV